MLNLGQTTSEGKILKWLKKPGDKVSRGEFLLEVEADKVTMEVEAYISGLSFAKTPSAEWLGHPWHDWRDRNRFFAATTSQPEGFSRLMKKGFGAWQDY